MKLTIFYDKQDIDFLLQFTPISEALFIEHKGCDVDRLWEPGTDCEFLEKLIEAHNILVVLSSASKNSKWVTYIMGFAAGSDKNCHYFSMNEDIKEWSSQYSKSNSMSELTEYYNNYNNQWFQEAAIQIARRTLTDMNQDVTLTAFVEAVKEGNSLLAGIYLEAGFKPDDADKDGVPLICWAARKRRLSLIQLLMWAGADINAVSVDRDNTALIDAVSEDDYEIVTYILEYNPSLENKSKNGQTALTIASGHNNVEIVRILVEQGASADTVDKLGMSPISYAKMQQNEEIIKLLSLEH